jgi:thioredoxin-like negative regulator of GroEL
MNGAVDRSPHIRVLRFAFCLLATAFCPLPSARSEGVQWRHDYNSARKEAHEKGRPLLLDFGTENCFWCRRQDETTFQHPTVQKILNEQFIPIKVDAERSPYLTEALRVQAYPTIVVAATDGKILHTLEGYQDAARLSDLLKRAQSAGRGAEKSQIRLGSVKPSDVVAQTPEDRARRARELLAQARDDFQTQQFHSCIDCCETLVARFVDRPESAEAARLLGEIKNNPESMRRASEMLSDRLGNIYLSMADACLTKGESQQAYAYLERVLQAAPGTRAAESARVRLTQVNAKPPR